MRRYFMAYYIHSRDPVKNPVPAPYYEGQIFNIGGEGNNDIAYYSKPELFFQMFFGIGELASGERNDWPVLIRRPDRPTVVGHIER
jgi:hypothetical protein